MNGQIMSAQVLARLTDLYHFEATPKRQGRKALLTLQPGLFASEMHEQKVVEKNKNKQAN